MKLCQSLFIAAVLADTAQGQSWDPDLEGGPRPSPLPLHYDEGARFATRLIALPGGGLQLGFIDALLPADTLPMVVKRRYFSGLTREGVLGAGWASTLDVRLLVDEAGGEIRIAEVDGKVSVYRSGGGKIEPVAAHFLQHTLSRADGGFIRQWSDGAREHFDATGRLLKRSAGNDAITFTYENAKAPLPSRVTDAAGRALDLAYQDGLLSQISDPLGRKTSFHYERRRLVEVTDAADRVVRFAYDVSGRLAMLTLPLGQKIAFEFNAEGHLTRVSGPAAINAAFAWQPVKDSPARELVTTFANGSTEKLQLSPGLYDPNEWNLPEAPEPRRAGLGFRIQRTNGTGASTSAFVMSGKVLMSDPALPGAMAFDHQGRLTVSGAAAPDPSAAAQALQEHAAQNEAPFWRARITPVLIPSSQPDVRYDAAGRAVEFVLAQGRTEKWRWDAADRVVEWTSAEGAVTQQSYDAHNHLLTSVTDGKPGATFEYDANDVLAAARDASEARTAFAYDKAGNLSVVTLPDGSKIQQTYDAASRLTSIILPDGKAATFEYDAQGQVIKTTAPDGSMTSCAYDLQGRKTSETDEKGGVTRYTYDAFGRLASVTPPDGSVVTYTWSDQGVALRSKSADGSETTEAYDRAGRLVHAQGPKGMEFKDSYDAAGRLLSRTDSIHGTATFTYDAAGRKTTETQNGLTRSWHYDAQGRVASIDEGGTKATIRYLEGGGHVITTQAGDTKDEREYDAAGRVVAERDDLGQEARFTYDASGNLLRTATRDGVTIAYEYDKVGHATSVTTTVKGVTSTVSYTYDEMGNVTSIVRADGTMEKFAYDAEGRVIEQVDGFGGVTRQEFDEAGRLVKVTSPHGVRTLKHDSQGRVVEDADPVEGTLRFDYSKPGEVTITDPEGFKMTRRANTYDQPLATVDPLGNTVRREYDASGRLTAFVDPNQHKTTFAYPDDGRTMERRTPGGKVFRSISAEDGRPLESSPSDGRTVTWEYDARGRLLLSREGDQRLWSYQYGPTGRLQSVEGSAGEFRYDFDPLDRLLSSRDPFGKEVAFTYDAPGRIETIRSPDGDTFAHRYNDKGLVASIESGMGMTRFEYDALGRLVGITHPNGMTVQQTYEAGSSLKSIEARNAAGTVLHKEEYSYDKRGNLTRLVDADGTSTFQYDGAGRLIKATHAGGPEEKFTYDAAGNVIASTEVADWKYDADNQLVAWNGQRIESDARGNVTTLPDVGGFKWNAADQLTEVALRGGGTLSFAYDAEGRRVEKKSAAAVTRYAYAGEQLLAEYDGAGKQLALYVPGVEASLWLAVRLDGQEYYAIRSRLGSLVALADSKGRIVKRFRYDSYGHAFKTEGSLPLPAQFAGRPVDAETGLIQFGARLYSPQLKRFLTPDPAGPDKDGNTYAYALSNPLSFTDLAGTKGTPIIHSGPGLPRPPVTGPLAAPKPSLIPGLSIRPRPLPPIAGTVPQNLPDFHRAVMDELRRTALSDPHGPSGYVARRTLDMINSGQVKLDIRSTDPLKEGALGRCPWGKNRVIIAREGHNTIRAAAATVVHEVAHVRQSMGGAAYRMGHEFQAEFRAWLVDKTLGTGRKVGVPELVDRVLKSYNAASGTPGNLTVKTVEREIRHFFPGAEGRALTDEFRAALRTAPRPPAAGTGSLAGGMPRLTGPLASELAADAGRVLRTGAAAEARSVASILGRAGLRALPFVGTAVSVITADSPADIAKAIGYMIPGVSQVLMAKDAIDFAIWAGQSIGQLAADAYLNARDKYNKFFGALEDIGKQIEGEEDEETKAKKRRRNSALEDRAGASSEDANLGPWTGAGGGGPMVLNNTRLPSPSQPPTPSKPPTTSSPASNPSTPAPAVPPMTTPANPSATTPPPNTPANPNAPPAPTNSAATRPPPTKPDATIAAATPTNPAGTMPPRPPTTTTAPANTSPNATAPHPRVNSGTTAPSRPWSRKRRILGDAIDGALGGGPDIREPSPPRSARHSRPAKGSRGGGGGIVGALTDVAESMNAAGGKTADLVPDSTPSSPYTDPLPPEEPPPLDEGDNPPDTPQPDDPDDPFLGAPPEEGLPLPPPPAPSPPTDDPAATPTETTSTPPSPPADDKPAPPPDSTPPEPPKPPEKPVEPPPPAPPPPAPPPERPSYVEPIRPPVEFNPGPESDSSESPGIVESLINLWNKITDTLNGTADKIERGH